MKLSIQNEKNVVLNEKSVEGKPCTNREIKSDKLKIYLYSCYGINMKLLAVVAPPYIYLSFLTRNTCWEEVFTGKENLFLAVKIKKVWSSEC